MMEETQPASESQIAESLASGNTATSPTSPAMSAPPTPSPEHAESVHWLKLSGINPNFNP